MIRTDGIRAALNKSILFFILVAVLAAASLLNTGMPAYAQSPDDGETVFEANGCSTCHSTGTDTIIGPGLSGLFDRAGSTVPGQSAEDYVRESIVDPGAFVVEGFANLMPATFAASLSSGDLQDLIAYLGTLGAQGGLDTGEPVPELISVQVTEGDAERGENFFTGPTRFENRGPSCSACHSSSGLGALGGGSLGPDLTGAFARLGDALIIWPETVVPMRPIYTERPLTEQEKADLLAFFKSADITQRDTTQVAQLFGLAVAGLAIIAVFTHLIWRRRLHGVRKSLVGDSNTLSGLSEPRDTSTLLLVAFLLAIAGSIAAGLGIIVVTVT